MPALRFPVYDLDSSIEVAKTLHEHGGTASTHELASYLGYMERFRQIMEASVPA